MPNVTIPWTLEIIGKTVGTNAKGEKRGLVAEFDCELSVNYWGETKYDECGWELDAVTVEWNHPPQRHIITKDSDPAMWEIIMRGWKADELRISDKIIEAIGEDMDNARYEPDYSAMEAYR